MQLQLYNGVNEVLLVLRKKKSQVHKWAFRPGKQATELVTKAHASSVSELSHFEAHSAQEICTTPSTTHGTVTQHLSRESDDAQDTLIKQR